MIRNSEVERLSRIQAFVYEGVRPEDNDEFGRWLKEQGESASDYIKEMVAGYKNGILTLKECCYRIIDKKAEELHREQLARVKELLRKSSWKQPEKDFVFRWIEGQRNSHDENILRQIRLYDDGLCNSRLCCKEILSYYETTKGGDHA